MVSLFTYLHIVFYNMTYFNLFRFAMTLVWGMGWEGEKTSLGARSKDVEVSEAMTWFPQRSLYLDGVVYLDLSVVNWSENMISCRVECNGFPLRPWLFHYKPRTLKAKGQRLVYFATRHLMAYPGPLVCPQLVFCLRERQVKTCTFILPLVRPKDVSKVSMQENAKSTSNVDG